MLAVFYDDTAQLPVAFRPEDVKFVQQISAEQAVIVLPDCRVTVKAASFLQLIQHINGMMQR